MTDTPEQSSPGRGPHAPMAGGTPGQHAGPHPIPRRMLRELVLEALDAGLRITELVAEPDGTCLFLTDARAGAPILDPLEEARLRRAAQDTGLAHRH
jgi:hypothetical protein